MTKNYWTNGVNEILKKVLNGKRTVQQAMVYIDENFVGQSRKAFKHMGWEATAADQTAEMTVYNMLREAVKLGFGKDTNLEGVFR